MPLTNTVTAASSAPTAYANATVNVQSTGERIISKTAYPVTVAAAGQLITYSYALSNAGITPLTGVVVTDDNGTPTVPDDGFNPTYVSGDYNGNGQLDYGETWYYTATHTVTQAEVNAGLPLVNTATATSNQLAAVSAVAAVVITHPTGMSVQKTANTYTATAVGQVITYTYTVTNNGTKPLYGISLTDDNGTPGVPGDDFHPTYVSGILGLSGDVNGNGAAEPGRNLDLHRQAHGDAGRNPRRVRRCSAR